MNERLRKKNDKGTKENGRKSAKDKKGKITDRKEEKRKGKDRDRRRKRKRNSRVY